MLSQSSSPQPRGNRRSSVGAKARVCDHCGRTFRRTEHLERHVRTHTKEKPYVCFCGAAFTRRDLLKRHTRITHENNGLISPTSQPQQEAAGQSLARRTPDPPVTQPYNVQPAPRSIFLSYHLP
ncbi:hypothetical protein AFLA_010198 [Aspergillus flavus NRRL3357]|nr:hypothetical protein AFLA_010198 [Aspergillus flavus NRRL3357]